MARLDGTVDIRPVSDDLDSQIRDIHINGEIRTFSLEPLDALIGWLGDASHCRYGYRIETVNGGVVLTI
jgi:hypothetical protein